jgi:hypothetical protein
MAAKFKAKLTYANILSTLAAVGVLAGSGAFAAAHDSGKTGPAATASGSVDKKVKKLKKRVAALESTVAGLQSGGGIASAGMVSFFNLGACPSGWSELTTAEGRYLVGLNPGGTLAATRGTALSDLENRAVGRHTHTVNDPGHSHTVTIPEGGTSAFPATSFLRPATANEGSTSPTTSTATTGITIDQAGSVAGTNAPYLQLLACQKG